MIVVQVVRLDGVYLSGASLDNLWDHAADAVVKRHYSLAADGFPRTATVVLDLPSAFFSLMWVCARGVCITLSINPSLPRTSLSLM